MRTIYTFLAGALIGVSLNAAQAQTAFPLKYAGPPTTAEISAGDLQSRLYIFADDSMQGRAAGTAGHFRATTYLGQELARLGLEPAGDAGTFFQTVPLKAITPVTSLTVNGAPLALGTDFLPLPGAFGLPFGGSLPGPETPVVFGGRFGADGAITPAEAAGKVVVFLPPLLANGQPTFGFWQSRAMAQYQTIGGIIVAALDIFPQNFVGFLSERSVRYLPTGEIPPGRFGALITAAAAMRIFGRPLDQVLPGATAAYPLVGRAGYDVGDPEAPARNVVAVLRGSDPALRGEYVAIGAHSDHIGISEAEDHDSLRAFNTVVRPRGADDEERPATADEARRIQHLLDSLRALRPARSDSINNGADDDGSGSVSVLEVAEALATSATRPKRSILFVWHVAEELGLFGSQHFTDFPTVPRDSIVAQINIDMIGRGSASDLANGGPGYLQLIGSRRLSTELGDLVERRNTDGKFGFTFDYQYDANGHPDQYYCRSDHYSYARYGIPVVFMSTGGHRDYHQLTDEPQYIDYSHMARVARFIQDIAVSVANLDHRVVVDKPKPDPHGDCVQ